MRNCISIMSIHHKILLEIHIYPSRFSAMIFVLFSFDFSSLQIPFLHFLQLPDKLEFTYLHRQVRVPFQFQYPQLFSFQ